MAGTVPTKGTLCRARSDGSTKVEAVLQAMTTASGRYRAIKRSSTMPTRSTSAGSLSRP
jgi:hypothetical protein